MALTPQQEIEIYPLLDQVLELAPGKAVQYRCTPQRATYLARVIQGLRYDTAFESLAMYDPLHPLYGKGVYANLYTESHPQGLLLTMLDSPQESLAWGILRCCVTKQEQVLNYRAGSVRQRLIRIKKKHPEVAKRLWVQSGEPPVVKYGQPSEEERVIVDIDLNPMEGLADPTAEELAKSKR